MLPLPLDAGYSLPPHPSPACCCPQLPPGRPLADALEYELQDLKRKQQQSD